MSGGRNPDYLFRIATTLHRLKQNERALTAAQEAMEAYADEAPRAAYSLLWQLTPDIESKRRIHETLVEKFTDSQDIARLELYTREDGSYQPQGISGSFQIPSSGTFNLRAGGAIPLQETTVTPDNIRFAPSTEPFEFVQPVYPEEARRRGIEGFTMLALDLDSNGGVSNPIILDSSPDRTFDDATLAAISQFRFDSSQVESNTGDFDMVYIIRYELPEQD